MAALGPTAHADLTDPDSVVELAAREHIDFTIVGPELPLSLGVVDRFVDEGRLIFGPSQAAARLESSKAFAKAFMARHHVPTARFQTCESAGRGAGGCGVRDVRVSGRAEGRRSRGRKGRRHCRGSRRRRRRHLRPHERAQVRRGGRSHRHRRMSVRTRGLVLRHQRRSNGRCRWRRRRITNASSTMTRGPTPVGWARSRRAWCSMRRSRRGSSATSSSRSSRGWRPKAIRFAASCTSA